MPQRRLFCPTTLLAATALSGTVAMPAAAEVGVAAAVNTDARGTPPAGAPRVIALGSRVVFKERVTTDGRGLVQLLLLDGTTFTIGPNSDLTIDEFIYDPASGDAKVVASLTKGAFRFVGARTSQKEGGATVNTPVGTIGIRGAIGYVSTDGMKLTVTKVAGNRFTVADIAGKVRELIFRNGWTAEVTRTASGETVSKARPATREEMQAFQQYLAGKAGTSGGAMRQPDDAMTQTSEVAQEGSQKLPGDNAPLPTPREIAVKAGPPEGLLQDPGEVAQATQDTVRAQLQESEQPGPGPGPDPDPGPGPGLDPTVNARLLMAPDVYTSVGVPMPWLGGTVGGRGLVGTTPESDQALFFQPQGGNLVASTPVGTISLADYSGTQGDAGLQQFAATGTTPWGPVSGPAYAGVGDFVAYMLGINGDPAQPFYVIYGASTGVDDLTAITEGSDIRRYSLTEDPIRPSAVPFFIDDLYGPMTPESYASSDLYIVEPGNDPGGEAKVFQSWVSIEGQGPDQKSAVQVFTSGVYRETDSGQYIIDGSRRGSYRVEAADGPAVMRGGVGTVAGSDGGHFFGETAQNFVIGAEVGDYYNDPYHPDITGLFSGDPQEGYAGDGGPAGTHHVADLLDESPAGSYDRTSRTRVGFMSGLAEGSQGGIADGGYILTDHRIQDYYQAEGGTNFTISLDATTNSVEADGNVWDAYNQNLDVAGFELGFGGGTRGVFVDDKTYGARAAADPDRTQVHVSLPDDPSPLLSAPDTGGFGPANYIVSGRANPIAGYDLCSQCDFIDWGWWGTRVVSTPSGEDPREDYVHMGTWVAGDVSAPEQVYDGSSLPFNGAAEYSGRAIGTISRFDGTRTNTYLATGDVAMYWDFGSRTGDFQIDDFDGDIGMFGSLYEGINPNQALFAGALSGGDGGGSYYNGTVMGAFVRDGTNPAGGVIGNFDFSGSGANAVGSFAGIGSEYSGL